MRYFGISKRVKVSDKLEPKDFDRSKVFAEVTPVIHKKDYLVVFSKEANLILDILCKDYFTDAILHSISEVGTRRDIHITLRCNIELLNLLRMQLYYITYRELK